MLCVRYPRTQSVLDWPGDAEHRHKRHIVKIKGAVLKVYLIGILAGALSLLTLLLTVYLGLALFTVAFPLVSALIEADATETPLANASILSSLGGSLSNLLNGLWQARPAYMIGGILGGCAAWAHQVGLASRKERAWLISFIGMALLLAVAFITWTNIQTEAAAVQLANNPELFRLWRDLLLGSYATRVSVNLIFAFTAAYPIWALWRWWYTRLPMWLTRGKGATEPEAALSLAQSAFAEHQSQAARLRELRQQGGTIAEKVVEPEVAPAKSSPLSDLKRRQFIKSSAILLVISLALLFLSDRYHDQAALRFQHGVAVLEETSDRTHQHFPITVESDVQQIRVVNINGQGTVNIYLSPTIDYADAVAQVDDWSFKWRDDEYLYTDVPTAEVAPGPYYLHFVQAEGWGYFEYALSQGGGSLSQISALVTGFLLAFSLVLVLALIILGPARNFI